MTSSAMTLRFQSNATGALLVMAHPFRSTTSHAMKPFYRFTRLSDECHCRAGHIYKECCFHSDLCGFIGAVVLIALSLLLPPGGWVLRIVWAIGGVVVWFFVFKRIRGWFAKRRVRTGRQRHDANHVV